jgi:hypothetical protein
MASEILSVPEENLEDVIKVLREGLKHVKVKHEVATQLERWCDKEQHYLEQLRS